MQTQTRSVSAGRATPAFRALGAFFVVPWAMFVASFLYYVVLTLVAIGVEQLPDRVMTAAYLLPVVAYAGVLLSRGLAGLAIHGGHAAARHGTVNA